MFNYDKKKFDKYCEMYSSFFHNEEIPKYSEINYVELEKKVVNKFREMEDIDKAYNEVILKDKILEYSECSINYTPIYSGVLAFIGVLMAAFLKDFIDKNLKVDYIMINFILAIFVFSILYFLFHELKNNSDRLIRKGFYQMCLNLLTMINEGEFKETDKDKTGDDTIEKINSSYFK